MSLVLRHSLVFMLVIFSIASLTTGCKSKSPPKGETSQAGSQSAPVQQLSVDDLVAPIALYPDQLLAQVLAVAVNPQEVLDLGNWLLQNQNLQGDAATNAAKQAGFSPSAQYLAMFPQVVDNMCQQMNWTRQLGEAFKSNQAAVMQAVQRKRTQAQQMGNLNSSPQMKVENKKADNGEKYVAIQPADPKVVYVPQYNPVTIYNNPAPAAPAQTTTTTSEEKSGVSTGTAVAIGLLSFGVGMAVGSAFNDNYYPYPAWGYSSVYVARRPYYPPVYRAPVYAGYRPAYGYNPPGNYRWNQYNRNMNVNVNNNYYNRFNNANVNARAANTRQAYQNRNQSANARPLQNQSNWKGQSTYQGARRTAPGERPGASMANAIPRSQQYGQRSNNQLAANRASAGSFDAAANRPTAGSLGSGASNLDANRGSAASRSASQPNFNRGGDRGYDTSSLSTRAANSSAPSFDRSASSSAARQNLSSGGAFSGAGGSGRQERTASSRGRASFSGGGRSGRRGR
ncbi:MAG: DUF3300 domain-containing protein [Acidobacteriales bacterium]|nr:DUF3300 domain-containing protein [Terriglobales bacterium]